MILSGKEIKNRMAKGDIIIRPFDEKQLNPNSYNLKLHNELIVYDEPVLDMAKDNAYHIIKIPKEGLVLEPGKLYLGRTVEFTETQNLVPMLEGRSSIGRLGIYIHVTAGFGDVGFAGCWTLEIQCVQPVRIYPFVDICQIYYHTIEGEYEGYSSKGKYQGATGIQTSQIWKEFGAKPNPLNSGHLIKKEDVDDFLKYKSWDDAMTTVGLHSMIMSKILKELGQQLQTGFEDGVNDVNPKTKSKLKDLLQKPKSPLVNPCEGCKEYWSSIKYVDGHLVRETCKDDCWRYLDYMAKKERD